MGVGISEMTLRLRWSGGRVASLGKRCGQDDLSFQADSASRVDATAAP